MSIHRTDFRARVAALVMLLAALVSAPALAQKSGAPGSPPAPTRPLPTKAAPAKTRAAPRTTPRAPATTPTASPVRKDAPAAPPARTRSLPAAAKPAPRSTASNSAIKTNNLAVLEYSPNGPGTVTPKRHALSAGIGWPAFEVGYLYGFRDNLSLGATMVVGYGAGVFPLGTGSLALMGTVKWRFAKLGPLDAGVRFSLGYYLLPRVGGAGHGLALDAAFLLHYQIMKGLSIEPFFAMPIRAAFFGSYSSATIPLYVGVSTEYMVLPRLKVFVRVGIGGAIVAETTPPNFTGTSTVGTGGTVWLDFTAGVGYQF